MRFKKLTDSFYKLKDTDNRILRTFMNSRTYLWGEVQFCVCHSKMDSAKNWPSPLPWRQAVQRLSTLASIILDVCPEAGLHVHGHFWSSFFPKEHIIMSKFRSSLCEHIYKSTWTWSKLYINSYFEDRYQIKFHHI